MNIDFKLIGQRIKSERKSKGITQENLAEALDVSVGYVSQLERGITKLSLDTLGAISLHLGCDVAGLITETVPKAKNYMLDDLMKELSMLDAKKRRLVLDFIRLL